MTYRSKEDYESDARVVMTLDAGGTNLEFSAMRGAREILDPIVLPCVPGDLDLILKALEEGFGKAAYSISDPVHAISFAFPGPANYELGIIGDLPNLPAFRGGVALGPFLERKFGVPVFINNDANLFALGEYLFGFTPWVNGAFQERGSDRRYRNLVGITLGSGFGCGLLINGQLNTGDNSNGGEAWLMRNRLFPELCTDASVGQEKIRRFYAEYTEMEPDAVPGSKEIYHIAMGSLEGNRKAALKAFTVAGEIIGDALANISVLVDGLVVIGGGLSGAHELLLPAIMKELNGTIYHLDGVGHPRIAQKAFNLDDGEQRRAFIEGEMRTIPVPFTDDTVSFDAMARTGVGLTRLGTGRAIALGAYVVALTGRD